MQVAINMETICTVGNPARLLTTNYTKYSAGFGCSLKGCDTAGLVSNVRFRKRFGSQNSKPTAGIKELPETSALWSPLTICHSPSRVGAAHTFLSAFSNMTTSSQTDTAPGASVQPHQLLNK